MENFRVSFNKTYSFENEEFNELDLSGLENLSTRDLLEADKTFNASGQMAMMNEMATGYALIIASKATKLPIEFFENLPAKEGLKVKNVVLSFLNQ